MPESVTPAWRRPGQIGPVTLRNRVIKAATYEGMSPGGVPSEALERFHQRLAAGGVAMTTVAYCAVDRHARTFPDQLWMRPEIEPALARLVDAVHREGARASVQLSHCGLFSKLPSARGSLPRGPSWALNRYGAAAGRPLARPMDRADLDAVVDQFAAAAQGAARVGFDAVEVHVGHGYLLSQFLSPRTNRRRDDYGGTLDHRAKLATEVVAAVAAAVGPQTAVLVKLNGDDGVRGGLEIDEAVEVATRLERAGAHAFEVTGGMVDRNAMFLLRGNPPLSRMIEHERNPLQRAALRAFGPRVLPAIPFTEHYFEPIADRVRTATTVPTILLGGVVAVAGIEAAMTRGFGFVALGRALIADPDLIHRFADGRATRTRCTACNECIVTMDEGGVRCVLDDAESAAVGSASS